MRLQRVFTKVILWTAVLAAQFAFVPAQAADPKDNIEGVIWSRQGNNLVLRGKAGTVLNVALTGSTTVYEHQGPLGIIPSSASADMLVPGLRILVEPVSAAQKNVAKSIQFKTSDRETLEAIQAALVAPQAQIQALTQELAAQKQQNSMQDQAIAASNKRIGDLADYDQKAEVSILFDVNSASLSDKAKADLKEIAAKAKTYRGYLIQVAGYTDAVGSAGRNQALSDRAKVNWQG